MELMLAFQQIESEEAMDGGAPSIRLFGVTEHGNSVMCHVTGFLPYFYIPAPIGFQRQHLQPLQLALEVYLLCSLLMVESRESRSACNPPYRNFHEGIDMGIQRKPKDTIPEDHIA